MSVTVRTTDAIVESMLDVFEAITGMTMDRNPGSVIRTLFEAAGLVDAEQFVQAVKALDSFYIETATGDDLDRRAADFDVTRLEADFARLSVVLGDTRVVAPTTGVLTAQCTAGDNHCDLADTTGFPAAGYVILDRGDGAKRERLQYTKGPASVLNFTGVSAFTHLVGGTVYLSVQGADTPVATGTKVLVPATAVSAEVVFATEADAVIYDGDRVAAAVGAQAVETGIGGNVAPGRITDFQTKPFETAIIVSNTAGSGGRSAETDSQFRTRLRGYIRGLSKSTLSALESLIVGVKVADSVIASGQVVEGLTAGTSTLYVDDGTSTGIDPAALLAHVTAVETPLRPSTTKAGDKRGRIKLAPLAALTGPNGITLLKTPAGAAYKGTGVAAANEITDGAKGWGVNAYAGWKVVDSTGAVWAVASNTATKLTLSPGSTPSSGAYALVNPGAPEDMAAGGDWKVNLSTGDFEYTLGLEDKDAVVVTSYWYYGGVIAEAQKVVNGDPDDIENYPGLKAVGTQVLVAAPTVTVVTFVVTVVPAVGWTATTLTPLVKQAIENYVNNLKVGQDVAVNRALAAVLSVDGVDDASISTPAANVGIADGVVAKTNDLVITVH